MGIVDDVGPGVKGIKKGDRVVASFDMGCGQVWGNPGRSAFTHLYIGSLT